MSKKNKGDATLAVEKAINVLNRKRPTLFVFPQHSMVLWDISKSPDGEKMTIGNKSLGKLDLLKRSGFKVYKYRNHKDFEKELTKMYN